MVGSGCRPRSRRKRPFCGSATLARSFRRSGSRSFSSRFDGSKVSDSASIVDSGWDSRSFARSRSPTERRWTRRPAIRAVWRSSCGLPRRWSARGRRHRLPWPRTGTSSVASAHLSRLVKGMAPGSESATVRVALVDDDTGLVAVLERRFAALRWQLDVLNYGPGHDHLAAMRLHAAIVNPALTGLDYIERIGTALPGLAVLVLAGPAPVADRVRGLRAGADDWITKPCHPEELVARIQSVLRRRRAGAAPPAGGPGGA